MGHVFDEGPPRLGEWESPVDMGRRGAAERREQARRRVGRMGPPIR